MTRHFAYVLWSQKLQKRYVGYSTDPLVRLSQHNNGWGKFTSRGVPWQLRYSEEYASALDAKRRERYLKTGAGRTFLDRVFTADPGYPAKELPDNCLGFDYY